MVGTNNLKIGDNFVEQIGKNCKEKYFKFVGHVIDDKLNWDGHIEHVSKKLASSNFAINSSKNYLPLKIRKTLYYSLIESHLNYGNLLWGCSNKKSISKIENLQKKAIRNISLKSFRAHTEPLFKEMKILKFTDKLSYSRGIFMHKYRHGKLPPSFLGKFTDITNTEDLQTRDNHYNYQNKHSVRKNLQNFPFNQMIATWNSLEIELKATGEELEFSELLKSKYISNYSYDTNCRDNCFCCKG